MEHLSYKPLPYLINPCKALKLILRTQIHGRFFISLGLYADGLVGDSCLFLRLGDQHIAIMFRLHPVADQQVDIVLKKQPYFVCLYMGSC